MRGAGANLGVVTSFEYHLHPVGPVLGGMVLYPLSKARGVLRQFEKFSHQAPDELTTIGALLTAPDGQWVVAAAACYCGPLDAGENLMKPLRRFAQPVADLIAPQPYTKLQAQFDESFPTGRLYYFKGRTIRALSDGSLDILVEYGGASPTPQSAIVLQQLHGAASRVPVEATAFPHRCYHYDLGSDAGGDNPAEREKMVEWAWKGLQAIEPFAERAVYANFVRDAYGPNYDRLQALKNKYDRTNLFRPNANFRPTD